MTIFLQGGNTSPDNAIDNAWTAATVARGGHEVVFLPFALDRTSYDPAFAWFQDTYGDRLGTLGLSLADLDVELDPERVASVHLSGGYTDRLARILQESGLDERLAAYHGAGGLVYACSAGAIALGHDIRTAREVPDDYSPSAGLDWLGGHAVVAHFRQEGHLPEQAVTRWSHQFPLVAIPPDSGAVFAGGTFRSYGDVPCELWQGGQNKAILAQS